MQRNQTQPTYIQLLYMAPVNYMTYQELPKAGLRELPQLRHTKYDID